MPIYENIAAAGEVYAYDGETPTQGFGGNLGHYAIDLARAENADVQAVADGVVCGMDYNGEANGHIIVLKHTYTNKNDEEKTYYSSYSHCVNSNYDVEPGEKVVAGQRIAGVGSTGYSFDNHIHLSIYTANAPKYGPYGYYSNEYGPNASVPKFSDYITDQWETRYYDTSQYFNEGPNFIEKIDMWGKHTDEAKSVYDLINLFAAFMLMPKR